MIACRNHNTHDAVNANGYASPKNTGEISRIATQVMMTGAMITKTRIKKLILGEADQRFDSGSTSDVGRLDVPEALIH